MKTAKIILSILLGCGVFLVFNENIKALWLNAIGALCFIALLAINRNNTTNTAQ